MRYLFAVSQFLSKKTSLFIILVAIVTFFFRDIFSWVKGDIQSVILGIIMLSMGMTLTIKDLKTLAAHPKDILIGCISQFTVMPLIAYGLTHLFHLPVAISVGILLVGCCPGGVSSNIMSYLCKGDVAFSVGMTTVNTLIAPVVTPLLLLWLTGEDVKIDAIGMFENILIVTLIPITLGFLLNYKLTNNKHYKDVQSLMPGVAVIGLACIVGGVVSLHGNAFLQSGILIFITIFCHNALGYLVGYLVGMGLQFGTPKRRTISIEVGMQNAGLATNLASNHFPTYPEAAVVSAICCVWHSISGTILANIFVAYDDFKQKRNK